MANNDRLNAQVKIALAADCHVVRRARLAVGAVGGERVGGGRAVVVVGVVPGVEAYDVLDVARAEVIEEDD